MSDIKYYALITGEEPPMEFVAIRHVDGEPEFVASYVNSSYLSYENGVLLKMHERNDALRAENAKLRELTKRMARALGVGSNLCDRNCGWEFECDLVSCPIEEAMRELGIEVDDA